MNASQKWVVWIYSLVMGLFFLVNGLFAMLSALLNTPFNTSQSILMLGGTVLLSIGLLCAGINNYILAGVSKDASQ